MIQTLVDNVSDRTLSILEAIAERVTTKTIGIEQQITHLQASSQVGVIKPAQLIRPSLIVDEAIRGGKNKNILTLGALGIGGALLLIKLLGGKK
jgi:hypothetical protein